MFRPDLESRQISLPEPTVELPADLLDPLANVIADVFPQLVARIPPTPAAELGRIGAAERPTDRPGAPVLTALRSVGPRLPERLLGALELVVDEIPLHAPRGLTAALAGAPARPATAAATRALTPADEPEAVTAVAQLDRISPGACALIHSYLHRLLDHPEIAPLLVVDDRVFDVDDAADCAGDRFGAARDSARNSARDDDDEVGLAGDEATDGPADEATLAARHGAAHLALAVAVATAVLRELAPPSLGAEAPVVVGTAVGCAVLVLRGRPMPDAYPAALLMRRRADYRLPRQVIGCVHVEGHTFGLVEDIVEPAAEPAAKAAVEDAGRAVPAPDFHRNGLVDVVAGGARVRTGVGTGRVNVSLRVLAAPPGTPTPAEAAAWDEIVEVSWTAGAGAASVVGAVTSRAAAPPDARSLFHQTPPWPGDYRLRVCARGRDGAGEDETYELALWGAPAAPEVVHQRGDQLGHRLRGEELPPVTSQPETRYRWVRRRSEFREAATFTVVVGATPQDVVRYFDADPDAPCSLARLRAEGRTDPYLLVLPLAGADSGAVLAVEANGLQGSRHAVLSSVSRQGLAASMFWNINALTRLSLAQGGEVLAAFEPGPDAVPDAVLPLLRDLDLTGATDRVAKGLVVVERFTGHEIRPEQVQQMIDNDVAYLINQP
ncbi:hypothetical protein Ga0074812_11350 [Parafrankia irregularis]|uniref:Uncharacterized protein n=1 Tax=Parafrankia irregularis TaxID=795642 RepID=A0A0S4QPL4_9ACTN|nr:MULTISPECIES: DUF6461 domain-containing protein [Parafrankia]MBE3206227.1 hypothetical protein [Parafrankia sp. CH37]CUU57552.1 hypothetical protein Ga0074812_11350 [Parafrankia irregularis]